MSSKSEDFHTQLDLCLFDAIGAVGSHNNL